MQRWLDRHGLKLNKDKTRQLDVRQEGFKFLGFGISWRRGKSGRAYPPLEPHPKSQQKLRDKLNPWTLWRAADEVIPELNRRLKGWGGNFHCGHSTRVFDRMNHFVVNRLQRWLWRQGGCEQNLCETTPRETLQERWGLYRLPRWAAWKRALA